MAMLSLTLAFYLQSGPTLDALNEFARKRDVKSLATFSVGDGSEFRILRGGAYDVGRFGWKVVALEPAFTKRKFVVFTTPLTSQDTGELLFERVGGKLKFVSELDLEPIRLGRHKLSMKFSTSEKSISIVDDVAATVQEQIKGDVTSFRFSPCYKVSAISDGKSPVPFTQVGGVVMVPRPATNLTYSISYKGTVNLPLYAGAISPNNVTLTNDYWYPLVNRWPTTYDLTVEHPAEWEVIAQGNKIETKPSKGGVETTYKMDLPAVYWSFTVGKMRHIETDLDGLRHHVWSTNLTEDKMRYQPRFNAHILNFYSRSFGAYPFKQWGSLDSPTYGGGALEAYSFATYGEGWLPDADPHEPAHTWFGGILPNTYLRSFWNEGFAVWSEGFYERECALGSTEDRRAAFVKDCRASEDYNAAPLLASGVSIGGPASSLGYGKSGDVLAMLEQLIGTSNLLDAIKEWVRVHPKGTPAEWEEFEAIVLRRNQSLALKDFFDDWFRRPGFASVSVTGLSYTPGKLSGRLKWNGAKYRMPLELWMENGAGARQSVMLDTKECAPDGSFTIGVLGFTPKKIYFDPHHRALRDGAGPRFDSFGDATRGMKVYRDPATESYVKCYEGNLKELADLDKVLIVGHPDTTPKMKELCVKAGFSVKGQNLTFRGTTIDLTKAGAVALVDLGEGKRCGIALGKCDLSPKLGKAYVGLCDDIGRMLRGSTRFPLNASALPL
jgi:hypothetical protein